MREIPGPAGLDRRCSLVAIDWCADKAFYFLEASGLNASDTSHQNSSPVETREPRMRQQGW